MSSPPFVVCIPAAGSGSRMDSGIPKQYLPLAGKPVLAHTLSMFDGMESCETIIIATDDKRRLDHLLAEYPLRKDCFIVQGGDVRQKSVANMLAMCTDDEAIVLIHDAARPCILPELILAVVHAVEESGAALLALPVRDTVKATDGRYVTQTLDRNTIRLAQTPQGARAGIFRNAFAEADRDGFTGTDDVALLERLGIPVRVVDGLPSNLKITTPADLFLAEQILLRHGRS
jgi:2-C-methyl-D-erythritol 4-phosphate cytidylyltransferase